MKLRWLRSGSARYSSVVDKRILLLMLSTAYCRSESQTHRQRSPSLRISADFRRYYAYSYKIVWYCQRRCILCYRFQTTFSSVLIFVTIGHLLYFIGCSAAHTLLSRVNLQKMVIKDPNKPCICCQTTLWSIGFHQLSYCHIVTYRVKWRHRIYGHDTIVILWGNMA